MNNGCKQELRTRTSRTSLVARKRIEFKIILITFKILQGFAPKYLKDLISVLPASRYSLRRNNNGLLLCSPHIKTKKTMRDRSFMVAALALWNRLPLFTRSLKTTDSFKCAMKTFSFREAYAVHLI